jgi:two-component system phosphate regulon sensor histidine kinase PhoR
MARLIDDLLSLSRVEMSEHRRPVDEVDLLAVVKQAADLMQPLAHEKKVTVTFDAPSSPVMVAGDRDELLRVVENLTENAIKYGQAGGRVELVITAEAAGSQPCVECQLAVRDFGPGIAAEHLPRLTERFYRVDASASRETGGTGLGLAIVKHILNRHRGRLGIESEPGKGSIFRVTLPLWAADPDS